ncbi:MAG TPA: O-antigen ligase family protein [Steroidobacteraceae bacterium]
MSEVLPRNVALESGASELGMRMLLTVVIVLFVVQDVFDMSMSLAPGLSAKNALLYVLAGALVFKIAMQGSFRFEIRALHYCFAVLIGYAVFSWLVAAFMVEYPRYNVIGSAIRLKATWIDRALLFLVFFYALRSSRNAYTVLKVLLLAVALANTIAVLNGLGYLQTGRMGADDVDRVQGMMGEPNQDGAFDVLFIPGLATALLTASSLWRLPWFVGLLMTLIALVMTASRGGFVAFVVACLWAGFILRRYVPAQRLLAIAAGGVLFAVVAVLAVIPFYGSVLYRRVFEESTASDIAVASSGRTDIWSSAVAMMADTPITMLTGFGWNVYFTMPFRFAPHNYYLDLWFNLGLVGLACGTALLVLVVRETLGAVGHAAAMYRPALLAFAVGTVGISVATFFVDLYTPWLWYWAYAGLVLRIAVNAKNTAQAQHAVESQPRKADPYGWIAAGKTA